MTKMALHLARYDLRALFRNRRSRFFSLALPVVLLLVFGTVDGGRAHTTLIRGVPIRTSAFYVPGVITFAITMATFSSVVGWVTNQRERGVLMRRLATPVPAAAIIAGRVLASVVIAAVMTVVLLVIGWAVYGASVPGRTAIALVVTVVVAATAFCCLGYGLTSVIRSAAVAGATTQAVLIPLYFISGVFVSVLVLPSWLVNLGEIFPVRHLVNALFAAYNPYSTGMGFAGQDLLVIAVWGIAGLILAVSKFSWEPLGR